MAPTVLRRTPHDAALLDRTGIISASVPTQGIEDAEPGGRGLNRSGVASLAAFVLMGIVALSGVFEGVKSDGGGSTVIASGVPTRGPVAVAEPPAPPPVIAEDVPEPRPVPAPQAATPVDTEPEPAPEPEPQSADIVVAQEQRPDPLPDVRLPVARADTSADRAREHVLAMAEPFARDLGRWAGSFHDGQSYGDLRYDGDRDSDGRYGGDRDRGDDDARGFGDGRMGDLLRSDW
ncbi:hypothetical protein ACFS2C_27580 [Prauserella oleivorans]|uniref:Uncharacterized protein n=1 Tax=Prauserella oleivorans TaxID=1478153 RepID=A0ABW5WJ13_9PSEU